MEQYGAFGEQSFYTGYNCRKPLEICFSVKMISFTFFENIKKTISFKRGQL